MTGREKSSTWKGSEDSLIFTPQTISVSNQWALKRTCLDFCSFFFFFFFLHMQSFLRVPCYLTNDRNLEHPCQVLAMNWFPFFFFFNRLGQRSRDFSGLTFGVSPTFKLYCPTEYPTRFVGGIETIKIHLVPRLRRNPWAFILTDFCSTWNAIDSNFLGSQWTKEW